MGASRERAWSSRYIRINFRLATEVTIECGSRRAFVFSSWLNPKVAFINEIEDKKTGKKIITSEVKGADTCLTVNLRNAELKYWSFAAKEELAHLVVDADMVLAYILLTNSLCRCVIDGVQTQNILCSRRRFSFPLSSISNLPEENGVPAIRGNFIFPTLRMVVAPMFMVAQPQLSSMIR